MQFKADKETFQHLENRLGHVQQFEIPRDERESKYFSRQIYPAPLPDPEPRADPLGVSTLASIAAYCKSNVDKLDLAHHLIHVAGPDVVFLLSPLLGEHRQRETLLAALYKATAGECVDTWLSLDSAKLALLSQFEQSDSLGILCELFSRVTSSGAEVIEDAGLNQTVTVTKGVALKKREGVKPVHVLRPRLTFPECEQIEVAYAVRIRREKDDEPVEVLFQEADGGRWKLEAVKRIAEKLTELLSDVPEAPQILY